jgi:hypothetical protein
MFTRVFNVCAAYRETEAQISSVQTWNICEQLVAKPEVFWDPSKLNSYLFDHNYKVVQI